jgi:hypothetical protein
LEGIPLRTLARSKKTQDLREKRLGHQGPYLPLIFEACDEGEYAYEYQDGATSYGAFTYFLAKILFKAAGDKKKVTFQSLVKKTGDLLEEYYQQTPHLVGPKKWCSATVPWKVKPKKTPARSSSRKAKK